jgi:alcohol dehydrogenase (cytochrome c)
MRVPRSAAVAAVALATAVVAAVAVSVSAQPATRAPGDRLPGPAAGHRDWPLFGGDADNTRFSPLAQINPATAGHLRVAWTRTEGFGHTTWESFPVVAGTRMYVTTSTNAVWALDAATGKRLWAYTPLVNFFPAGAASSYFPANRGVAVAGGRVYELTFDDRLVALDAATGRPLWQARVADPRLGYYETTAPTVWRGLVFAGASGGDAGVRGFVAAYDGRTGKQVWRFWTVPAPGHGWVPARGHHGGGAVWMPPVIDTSTGILYAGTGNPSPDFTGTVRPGADPDTDGILALRASTGQRVWFTSLVGHDISDYDAASPVVLMRVRRPGGGTVRAVGEAGKSGRYYLLDAATGKPLWRPVAFVPVGPVGSTRCPGELGGSNYAPVAYDPVTRAAYVSGVDLCSTVRESGPAAVARHRTGEPDQGGTAEPAQAAGRGTFTAIDVDTGRVRWQRRIASPMLGGAAVAGGLVFTGSNAGILYAFDAATGALAWQRGLGAGFGTAPVLYSVRGREYLAVVTGGAAISAINHLGPVGGRLVVFTLPDSGTN